MNALETSLCESCVHLIYCSLTNDKSFIWSCSDYEASEVQNAAFLGKIMNDTKGISSSGSTTVLV